ncbi:hypothetical protein Rhe02_33880 [Rhizocola hellebori]|uniref:Uncharacterized protein n=1 Tax=Rhizocola hellebori TaxID=1392758 RepID=A0A8J3VGT1_9ACTN|nr:hypothetical protein [Rhizocola hellebori]GIH05321.1 hypothetical protein Rhe02_33880 [Rhizocola hellebori]
MTEYQQQLRDRFLGAPVMPAPAPWIGLHGQNTTIAVGGLIGVGFALDPVTGADLLMVTSHNGRGLFDSASGTRTARDYDADLCYPIGPDLSCPGIGVLDDTRVRIAGLFGGGLHATTGDGWKIDVVAPDWPNERILLSGRGADAYRGMLGADWWHIFHSNYSELRAAGFSPSGRTLVVATSSDITVWHRP